MRNSVHTPPNASSCVPHHHRWCTCEVYFALKDEIMKPAIASVQRVTRWIGKKRTALIALWVLFDSPSCITVSDHIQRGHVHGGLGGRRRTLSYQTLNSLNAPAECRPPGAGGSRRWPNAAERNRIFVFYFVRTLGILWKVVCVSFAVERNGP